MEEKAPPPLPPSPPLSFKQMLIITITIGDVTGKIF
jgi:hypothetical protein